MSAFGGFGVSLSDIVLIADFTSRVRSAFDEDTGAKAQYQHLVQSLHSLEAVLIDLKGLSLTNADLGFDGRLDGQTTGSLSLITHFKNSIEKYERRLGPNALPGRFKGPFRKIQWAVDAAKDLDDFRRALAPGLDAMKLMGSRANMSVRNECGMYIAHVSRLLASRLQMDVKAQSSLIESTASKQTVHLDSGINLLAQQNHRIQASLSDIQDNIDGKTLVVLAESRQANSTLADLAIAVSQMSLQLDKLINTQNSATESSTESNDSNRMNSPNACSPDSSFITRVARNVVPSAAVGYVRNSLWHS